MIRRPSRRVLAEAENLDTASVLPPYLEGLLTQRTGGDRAAARAFYESALQLSPTFYPAARALAGLIIETGRAPQELSRLLDLADVLPVAHDQLEAKARAYLAGGKPDLAADTAAQGLLASPDDPAFALLRARALEAQGDWYPALRIFEALIKLQPDMPEALLARARLTYEKLEDPTKALALISEAEARFSKDTGFPELAGQILMETGAVSEAVPDLELALSLAPGRSSTISLLARAAAEQQKWSDSLRWFDELPVSAKGPEELRDAWESATALADQSRALSLARALEAAAPGPSSMILEARSLVSQNQGLAAITVVDAALAMGGTAAQRAEAYFIRSTAGSADPCVISDLPCARIPITRPPFSHLSMRSPRTRTTAKRWNTRGMPRRSRRKTLTSPVG